MPARSSSALSRLLNDVGPVDKVAIEERVAKYTTRSIKKTSKVQALKLAVTMVDLTTLEGKDTPGKVASMSRASITMCSSPGLCAVVEITGRPSARTTSTMIAESGTRMPTVRRSDGSGCRPVPRAAGS